VYFVAGDRDRVDLVRTQQPTLANADERFLLDAPEPAWQPHRSVSAGQNVNTVLSGATTYAGRTERLFFKPLSGVNPTQAHGYGHDSIVDLALHEVIAWRLARALGDPWDAMVVPAVWFDPPWARGIIDCGSVSLGAGGRAEIPVPGTGFDGLVSDAAFFDALIGAQDRHDQNLRARAKPCTLRLIDHGYSFAKPGDFHNNFPTAGFFLRLRFGERRFVIPPLTTLDYSGIGALDPSLAAHEVNAISVLRSDLTGLLGIADLLQSDRADALRARIDRMAQAPATVLRWGEY
jgi:hypothetical protein